VGKGRKPIPSKEMTQFIVKYRLETASPHKLSSQEIVERILFPLVNEGFKILEEGIADKPSDIDIIYIYGYGWPAWQGTYIYYFSFTLFVPH
jgi:3-hydroxyacyl-CoA dehydrogenase